MDRPNRGFFNSPLGRRLVIRGQYDPGVVAQHVTSYRNARPILIKKIKKNRMHFLGYI